MINLVKVKVKMELGAHESHPEIKALVEIIALRKQVEQVKKGSLIADNVLDKSERSRGLTFVPLSRIPEMKMELEQLMREKMVQRGVQSIGKRM